MNYIINARALQVSRELDTIRLELACDDISAARRSELLEQESIARTDLAAMLAEATPIKRTRKAKRQT